MPAFADCLEAIAGLVERFWPDVHPKALEGDFTLRQNVLSGLDDWWQVIQPLQHATLVRDKRLGAITLRHFVVASGGAEKRADEVAPRVSRDPPRPIAAEENRALSDLNFDAAMRSGRRRLSKCAKLSSRIPATTTFRASIA